MLGLVVLALHARAIGFDFVHADDVDLVAGNAAFLAEPANAWRVFTRSYFESANTLTDARTYFRPMAVLSFMIDAQIGGAGPAIPHATNVIIHAMVVVLLYRLMCRLRAAQGPAFAAALVFGVHPLTVQAVAWIAGRNELLLALFTGLAWLTLLRALDTREPWVWFVHGAMLLLALLSKETAIVLPAAFALAVWHDQAASVDGPTRAPVRRGLREWSWPVVVWLAAVGVWGALYVNAVGLPATPAAFPNLAEPVVALGKLALPVWLNVNPSVDARGLSLGVATLVGLAVTFGRGLGWRWQAAIWGWFLATFLPSLMVAGTPAYEHRAYLPIQGVLVGLALVAPGWAPRHTWVRRTAWLGVAAAFAVLTYQRSSVFVDPFRFWTDGTRDARFGAPAHVNLGQLLEAVENAAEAERHYRRAIALDPRVRGAHNNLGVIMARTERSSEAVRLFEQELSLHPDNVDALYNLGLIRAGEGGVDAAIGLWQRAIAVNRYYLPAYRSLADAYRARGDQARAREYDAIYEKRKMGTVPN